MLKASRHHLDPLLVNIICSVIPGDVDMANSIGFIPELSDLMILSCYFAI